AMPDISNTPSFLVRLAAEGMAATIPGCAKVLAVGSRSAPRQTAQDTTPPKAIDLFGPAIVQPWLTELGTYSAEEQLNALVQLSSLPSGQSRQEAATAIERYAAAAASEDKAIAIEYLTALPLAVRRVLVPDPNASQFTAPTPFTPDLALLFS